MHHSFDIKIAKQYSVEVAIFLDYIAHWTRINIANNKHFYENRYWTYNSYKSFSELFPYWGIQTIRNTIKKCIKHGLLIKGNFNIKRYDNTNWYSLSQEGLELFSILLEQYNTALFESTRVEHLCSPLLESTRPLLESTSPLVEINRPIPVTLQLHKPVVCAGAQENGTHTQNNQTLREKTLSNQDCKNAFKKRFSNKDTSLEVMYDLAVEKVGKGKDIGAAIFLNFITTERSERYPDKEIKKSECKPICDSGYQLYVSDFNGKKFRNEISSYSIPFTYEQWLSQQQPHDKFPQN